MCFLFSDTTLVIDTEFRTESAFEFLPTPFLAIALLMMALLIIPSPVVQTAVPVVVPVIVPTPVPTTLTATQRATQTSKYFGIKMLLLIFWGDNKIALLA